MNRGVAEPSACLRAPWSGLHDDVGPGGGPTTFKLSLPPVRRPT